jgi:hypothetical protein
MGLQLVTFLLIISCKTAISQTIQEGVQRFLDNNGFKYISLIENSSLPSETNVKMTRAIVKGGTSFMQSMTLYKYLETYTFTFLGTHIFILDVEKDNVDTFLQAITKAPVRSSVICVKSVWTDKEKANFQSSLKNHGLDAFFYFVVMSEHDFTWYQIITLKSGYAMTNLKFYPGSFQMVEDYDLNGLTIYSISLNSLPYLTMEDCDEDGKHCNTYGYLKDYADVISQKLNFTYESHKQVDGDWGSLPKSGPYNRSGKWGGVMGGVVNAKYDVSLGAWSWLRERYGLLSFVSIVSNNDLLLWTPTKQKFDIGLFVRPFSPSSILVGSFIGYGCSHTMYIHDSLYITKC